MYKIEVELEQHTPMIHFEINKGECGLRASDVKPRLDKYILELDKSIFGEGISEVQRAVKKKTASLYSLSICCNGYKKLKIDIPGKNINTQPKRTPYFGDEKEYVLFNQTFLTVRVFNSSVKDCIIAALPYLFALENFGIRQNKGFGSFSIRKINVENNGNITTDIKYKSTEEIFKEMTSDTVYFYPLSPDIKNEQHLYNIDSNDTAITQSYQILFQNIKYVYNTIKAGINMPPSPKGSNRYSKSLLFQYLKKKHPNLVWEKRAFKLEHGGTSDFDSSDSSYKIIRHILGLSDHYNFRKTEGDGARMDVDSYSPRSTFIDDPENDKIRFADNIRYSIKNTDYERIPSPIFIKPVKKEKGFLIYLVLKKDLALTNNQLKYLSFSVTKEKEVDVRKPDGSKKKTWSDITPNCLVNYKLQSIEEFDLADFFVFVETKFKTRLNKYVSGIQLKRLNSGSKQ